MARLLKLDRGEAARVALAFGILMLVVGSYTMVKSVRDAIFLSKFGITELSLMAIGLAVLTSFVVTIYIRATAGIPRNLLILGTYGVVAASLFGIWAGLGTEDPSSLLPWVLYIWSSVFGVFTVMQFWLLANDLFDPREAKRFFGVIGAGAILGGMSGGFLSKGLAAIISTRGLLLIAGGMLVCAAILANIVWPLRRRDQKKKKRKEKKGEQGGGIAALKESPYLRLLAFALFFATVTTTLLDWQFKGIIKAEFAGRTDEMAGFFGALYGYLSVASFLLQLLITGWVLRRFGVGVGLLLLPISLLFGSSAILFFGVLPFSRLTAASGAKIAEGGLRFAIDKASMELMWVPVPPRLKEQGKAFVDTVIDRFGTGVTGIIWLVLAYFGLDQDDRIHLISVLCLSCTVLWLWVLLRARAAYVGALRQTFTDRSLDLEDLKSSFVGAEASNTLAGFLDSGDRGELHFGLYLLSEMPGDLPDLNSVLSHADSGVRCTALELAASRADGRYRGIALMALAENSFTLRRAALDYLRATAGISADPGLRKTAGLEPLHDFSISVAKLAIPALAMQAADEIRNFIGAADDAKKLDAIELLSSAPPQMAAALLSPLLLLDGREIRRAAMRAAGRSKAVGTISTLLPLLDQRRWRPWAVTSLTEMGAEGTLPLASALDVQEGEAQQRLVQSIEAEAAMIRLIGAKGDVSAAQSLMPYCSVDVDDRLYVAALRGLVRLRRRVDFDVDTNTVSQLLNAEMLAMAADLLVLARGSWAETRSIERSEALFERALFDHVQQRGERIFNLLSLLHDPADMRAAYRGARSPSKNVRASTLEFLDNILDRGEKRQLMALIESTDATEFAAAAHSTFDLAKEDHAAVLQRHIQGKNEWLRAVSLWHVGHSGHKEMRPQVEMLADDVSALSAAVAKRALEELDSPEKQELTMGLTVVEKVLKLQSVDVFKAASTDDLAHVAQIAEEVELAAEEAVYAEGDAPDALYIVLSGEVKLHRGSDEIGQLSSGEAFGSWALLDEAPRVASATTVSASTLLKVEREEFLELLADRVDIVQAIFKAMVERLRKLAEMNL